jgi:SsrA-binding protein
MAKKKAGDIMINPKARKDYNILETYEAGIVLKGTEVKALRSGLAQIRDGFARVNDDRQAYLYNVHIEEYAYGNVYNHDPTTPRKLLLHKNEIEKLFALSSVKGHSLVVLSFHWKNNRVKVLLGVGEGKGDFDKRQDLRKRDADLEIKRAMMSRVKGR